MATAQTIIYDALKEIHVLAEGDTPSASMLDDALRALNRLIDTYSNDQSFSPFANHLSFPLTGQSSFTIGAVGADLIATRPIRLDTCTVDRNGITYPVAVIDNQKYDSIIYKAAAGANTTCVYYEATSPLGIVHLWPIATGCTLNLRVINQVLTLATLNAVLVMPPGYEEMLIKMLAVNIAPQYPAGTLSPLTIQAAKAAKKLIGNTNNVVPTMTIDSNLVNRHGGSLAAFLGGY